MKFKSPVLFISLAIGVVFSAAVQAQADLPVFDPINYVQNVLNQANTLKATVNQATQIAYQLQQLKLQVQGMRSIPRGLWGQIRSDLAALQHLVQHGQDISYTDQNLSSDFATMYPGFSSQTNFLQDYRQWSENALGGIATSLEDAQMQNQQLHSEDDVLQDLQAMSDGATGHMEALQVGNMVAMQEVQQLQKLRQLQMAQIQAQAGFFATQQQVQSTQYAALTAWIQSANDPAYKF